MKKLFYPALFHKAEEGGFWVSFPDIPECLTQGDDMEQSYEMAVEALGLSLTGYEQETLPFPAASEMAVDALGLALTCREKELQPLPEPSDPTAITPEANSFLVVVEFDMFAYKKRTNSRAVKKH